MAEKQDVAVEEVKVDEKKATEKKTAEKKETKKAAEAKVEVKAEEKKEEKKSVEVEKKEEAPAKKEEKPEVKKPEAKEAPQKEEKKAAPASTSFDKQSVKFVERARIYTHNGRNDVFITYTGNIIVGDEVAEGVHRVLYMKHGFGLAEGRTDSI